MAKKFKMEKISENKAMGETVIRFKPGKGDTIKFKDIKDFYQKAFKNKDIDSILIRGMSPDKERTFGIGKGHTTIKGLRDELKNFDDAEYYRDTVKDSTKFENFFYIDIYLYK
jgi:hypothetical protein